MKQLTVLSPSSPDECEIAALSAALAALTGQAQAEAELVATSDRVRWAHSGKLSRQGLRPAQIGTIPRWNTIERLRQRAAGGFYGIVGL